MATVRAVVFDMDGVIVDTEQVWDDVREQLVGERQRCQRWAGADRPFSSRS